MWIGNQQVQSMFHVNILAIEFDLDTVSCLWWWYTLADCPEIAETVLQLNTWSCAQSLGACCLFALMFHQLGCARHRTLIS